MPFDRQNIVEHLRATCEDFVQRAQGPAELLERPYGPGKWVGREVMAHLADCEFVNLWRFSKAVAEPGSVVEAFEEMHWAARLDYSKRPIKASLELFVGARKMLIHDMETLPTASLEAAAKHPEKGSFPGWRWANLAAYHAEHHLSQVAAAMEDRPWKLKLTPYSWEFGAAPRPQ